MDLQKGTRIAYPLSPPLQYIVYLAVLLTLVHPLTNSQQEALVVAGVVKSNAPMSQQQEAVECTNPNDDPTCLPCTLNPSFQYCTVQSFFDSCGILRIFGIVAACVLPVCILVAVPTIILNHISSLGWNILLSVTYLYR